MEVKITYKYNFEDSFSRIDTILNDAGDYEDVESIPLRGSLSYSNGYYVNCYAIFVDIRDSSTLPQKHKKKVLAKIYRCYISELVAIMQSYENCKEVNIVGDCVSGIFYSGIKNDVMEVFRASFQINSLVNTLNFKLEKKGFSSIKIGIGISKGKSLMILAGYKGSGLNDVVWMGDVVNHASHLCNNANKGLNDAIVLSDDVYNDLKGFKGGRNSDIEYQSWFRKVGDCYSGDIISIEMNDWLIEQKK